MKVQPVRDETEDARLLAASSAEPEPLRSRRWRLAAVAAVVGIAAAGAATAVAVFGGFGAHATVTGLPGSTVGFSSVTVVNDTAAMTTDDDKKDSEWEAHPFWWFENPWWCRMVGSRGDWEYKWFDEDSPCGTSDNGCCKRRLSSPAPDLLERAAKTCKMPPSASSNSTAEPSDDFEASATKTLHADAAEVDGSSEEKPWRRGSFIVIGDWGYDAVSHAGNQRPGCEGRIADKMHEAMEKLGDTKFVINVGDSFYPSGVANKGDPQWQKKWRNVFSPKARSVPWYSIYGNHDLHIDPCVCSDNMSKCAQVNPDEANLDFFVMPNYTYFKEMPELDLEIVGLDLNHFMTGWDHGKKKDQLLFADCEWTPCKETCPARMLERSEASFRLFKERMAASKAKNMLVFSHYPTDYFAGGAPEFLDQLSDNSVHDVIYFGGHRHSTDSWSTWGISPNTNWLVGGGGGWGCDTDAQGFVVGEIMQDYSVRTFRVLLDVEDCCLTPEKPTPAPPAVEREVNM